MIEFVIDREKMTPFPHYWEMCVGSPPYGVVAIDITTY